MRLEIKQLEDWIEQGIVKPGVGWGDAKETACLMTALAGATSTKGCVAAGWPEWLAVTGTYIFDEAGDAWRERSIGFARAVEAAQARGADLDVDGEVFCAWRLDSVLPIVLSAVGEGDEDWHVECRVVVQEAIDRGGKRADADRAAKASASAYSAASAYAYSAEAAFTAYSAASASAAEAAYADASAASAASAYAAAYADAASARTEANTRMYESLIKALKGEL